MAEGNNLDEDFLETTVVKETIGKVTTSTCIEGYEKVTTTTSKRKKERKTTSNSPNLSPSDREMEALHLNVGSELSSERLVHGNSDDSSSSDIEGNEIEPIRRVTEEILTSNQPKLPADRFKRIENPSISYDLISDSDGVRGFGIIFVNHFVGHPTYLRKGADEDTKLILQLFNNLGLRSIICEEKKAIEMLDIVKTYRNQHPDFNKYGSLFVAISTHGSEGDIIYGSDCEGILLDEIVSEFDNDKCVSMIGKPKVFLVQACRGALKDHQVGKKPLNVTHAKIDRSRVKYCVTSAVKQDCLVAYASNPGYTARRDENGSWFFQALYYAYTYFGNTFTDFEQILKLANRLMVENFILEEDDRLQPCNINSNLTKLLLMPYQPKNS